MVNAVPNDDVNGVLITVTDVFDDAIRCIISNVVYTPIEMFSTLFDM